MSAPAPPFTDRVSRNLVHRIQTACRLSLQELGLGRPARLLVGVSGGPDSSALLLALMPLAPRDRWSIVAAHIDHGIAPATDRQRFRDAAQAVADRVGVPLQIVPVDVPAAVARTGESVEATARTLRYQALVQLAASGFAQGTPADAIVVGHTMDDQAESVLLHLIRGSGADGLAGMAPTGVVPLSDATTPLLRPALGLRRAEMRSLCAVAGLDPAIDAANADPRYTRVRIRHHVLPALAAINPAIVPRLAALAGAVTVDRALLEQLTERALPQVALPPHAPPTPRPPARPIGPSPAPDSADAPSSANRSPSAPASSGATSSPPVAKHRTGIGPARCCALCSAVATACSAPAASSSRPARTSSASAATERAPPSRIAREIV